MSVKHTVTSSNTLGSVLPWSFRSCATRTGRILSSNLSEGFFWLNPPARYHLGDGLEIYTDRDTDFWQRTHYGFRRDDGHCLLTHQEGDFSLLTQVEFRPRQQYDQCGLMVRVDAENWIKLSTEYEDEQHSRLGSVVTNLGYSDWATQDVASNLRQLWYRISKRGADFLLEHSLDGQDWQQLRITHLHHLPEQLEQYGQLVRMMPPKATLQIERQNVARSLAAILRQHPIEDISVEDPPLEEVIAEMFSQVEQLSAAPV